jgi:hypothetical protein
MLSSVGVYSVEPQTAEILLKVDIVDSLTYSNNIALRLLALSKSVTCMPRHVAKLLQPLRKKSVHDQT